jgi:hypothetical protein
VDILELPSDAKFAGDERDVRYLVDVDMSAKEGVARYEVMQLSAQPIRCRRRNSGRWIVFRRRRVVEGVGQN